MRVELAGLSLKRGALTVLDHASLEFGPGEFLGLIGRNGAGKTTLMRAALGLVAASGRSSLADMPLARRALVAAWLPQDRITAWPVSVENLVRLGRIPHRRTPATPQAVETALTRMGLSALRHRPANRLSGGELGRALIARALAQETPVLMADEPVAGLDPAYQLGTMGLLRSLADEGRAVMASVHDLGLAARFCTRLVLMDQGRIIADGTPATVLRPDLLARAFGITGQFVDTAEGPVFQPLGILS
ncbi:MAG: ABC transporter ATP-binding protein [Paracoccus sp. (in: a-proteobacteria)]|nr:ABC transporter ATP-binding protein [Paracoccus sp. (in: a-proteobacteria)]